MRKNFFFSDLILSHGVGFCQNFDRDSIFYSHATLITLKILKDQIGVLDAYTRGTTSANEHFMYQTIEELQ